MITVYVECPFVLELALKQEQAEDCERVVNGARGGGFELALPIVALVEPLYALRGSSEKRKRAAEQWQAQVAQFKKTDTSLHRDAVSAMQDALLKMAKIEDHERRSVADTAGRLSAQCRLLPVRDSLFAKGFDLEQHFGLTSVDALAVSTIMDDAKTRGHDRVFLSLDKKSMTPIIPELNTLGVDVCHRAESLAGWLKKRGVTL